MKLDYHSVITCVGWRSILSQLLCWAHGEGWDLALGHAKSSLLFILSSVEYLLSLPYCFDLFVTGQWGRVSDPYSQFEYQHC